MKHKNNYANEVSEIAKKKGVKYWSVVEEKHPGTVTKVHNNSLDKHNAYMKKCAARRRSRLDVAG